MQLCGFLPTVIQEEEVAFGIDPRITEVLRVCEKAEFACAELFHCFAALFKDDRQIFHLWLRTALEEENRARIFALVGKLRHDNVIASVELEFAEAEEALRHIRLVLEKVKEHPPSLREALEIGIEIEIKLDRLMTQNVVTFADEAYDNSFLAMINSKHLESLRDAYQQLTA